MDVGLIQGLASGLSGFQKSYSEAQDRQRKIKELEADRELKKAMHEEGLITKGYKRDEAGGLIPDYDSPVWLMDQANKERYQAQIDLARGEQEIKKRESDLAARRRALEEANEGLIYQEGKGLIEGGPKTRTGELKAAQVKAAKARSTTKASPKPFKENQLKAATFGRRLEQAEEAFKKIQEAGYDPTSRWESLKRMAPGEWQSEQSRMQQQAERNFVNAVLRRESGAAISESEFRNAEQQYFPRPGDSPGVLAQKAANRAQILAGLKTEASGAWEAVPLVSPSGGLLPEKSMSPEEKEALAWANANPKDPRAAAIKQRLGVK